MNKKTRALIEGLLLRLKHCRPPGAYEELIKEAENLINPPVRLAWTHLLSSSVYFFEHAGTKYLIDKVQGDGTGRFTDKLKAGTPWRVLIHTEAHPEVELWCSSLVYAKQVCADYAAADALARRSKAKFAQIHTDPHIRKALMP